MARKRIRYQEGTWFAVPLRKGGFGIGLIARYDGKGIVLGYFFHCTYEQCPTIDDTHTINAAHIVLVRLFGDLGILRGEWPILGQQKEWHRDVWPVPLFGRIAVDRSRAVGVKYADDNIAYLGEISIPIEEATQLPEDGLSGYGAIEIRLTDLLTQPVQ